MKIYIVGSATYYADFIKDVSLVENIEDAEVVMFTGGEDVDPSLYGCRKHDTTYSNIRRDLREKEIFEKVRPDQLCVGCCRGAQFLCVMNGGILVQNCDRHAIGMTHGITDGKVTYQITSTHHQMQYPFLLDGADYDVLFTPEFNLSGYYEGDKINERVLIKHGEPEIVLYHKKDMPVCLAIQGHPEMIPNSPVAKMLDELINDLLNGKYNYRG